MHELATRAGGTRIGFANDVDVAADGRVFFSDSSTKYPPAQWGDMDEAGTLDLIEHGGHGRLLVYDPEGDSAGTLLENIQFANGVAVSPDQQFVLVCETGKYAVIRYWIAGPKRGEAEYLIESMPDFPNNISAGRDGRFWVALSSPRYPLVDRFSATPFVRRMLARIPTSLRPAPKRHQHVVALDRDGHILLDLQDPRASIGRISSVLEHEEHLYFGSLDAGVVARLRKAAVNL